MKNKKLLYDLFNAYYDCRKNKRNTTNALDFELNFEANIIKLREDVLYWKYEVWKSIAFIVEKPVKREIFAWDFRDRVIHHYVINKLNPYFEKLFIYDSYSCREQKGTLFWIKRIDKFIRSCSENYEKNCYILKLDIKGFFMSIDKKILHTKLQNFVQSKYFEDDKNIILDLIKKVIYNDPLKNCTIKWDRNNWEWLPKSKSLFFAWQNIGLAIWNLTSQIFANFYLDSLDKFIKTELKIKYYGRYVDDFILIHKEKDYLNYCKGKIETFLTKELNLTLHPNKIYLQHYKKGVLFLWSFIKPYRLYLKNKTKWNIFTKINTLNKQVDINNGGIREVLKQDFRQSINSYLGLIKWNNSYKLRKSILKNNISAFFWNYFKISKDYLKVVKK